VDTFLATEGIATEKYLNASGSLARAKLNEHLVVDYDYFKYCVMIIKVLMIKCQESALQLFADSKFEIIGKDEL
jgi:thiaminase